MTPVLLYCLASLDAAFIGYRAAAGRNALIDKRGYYRRAMLRGLLFGQCAAALIAAAIGAYLLSASDPRALLQGLLAAGARMLWVYCPYAVMIGTAFAVRAVPSVDVRSMTSVLIFGPFVLLRPAVAAAGIGWAIAAAPRLETALLGALILLLMLSLERLMGWCYYR